MIDKDILKATSKENVRYQYVNVTLVHSTQRDETSVLYNLIFILSGRFCSSRYGFILVYWELI